MKIYTEEKIIFWLKKQGFFAKNLLKISYLLNFINLCLLIIQNWILSKQIQTFFLKENKKIIFYNYVILFLCFIIKTFLTIIINKINFYYSEIIKISIRKKILNKFTSRYYEKLKSQTIGSDISLIINQVENLQDYYNKYIPQLFNVKITSLLILINIFFISWIIDLIMIIISIIIIFFIIIIGEKTTKKNKKNFKILSILNGLFFDRLKGIETIRLFNLYKIEIKKISFYIEKYRKKNIEILKIIFLTSVILEFFSSISLAFIIMYFSFIYLHIINFGFYNKEIKILHSFFILMLISKYFQNFSNLGILYHIRSKAIGAADNIIKLLNNKIYIFLKKKQFFLKKINKLEIIAKNLIVKNKKGNVLIGPISFKIFSGKNIVITGDNGCGKTTLFNVFLGLLPYNGSLKINNIEFKYINLYSWYKIISCVKQNPKLPAITIRKNLFFNKKINESKIKKIIKKIGIKDFLKKLPNGIDSSLCKEGIYLSVGELQRIAIARALIKDHIILLLDEPISNIDIKSQYDIIKSIKENNSPTKISITITHKICQINYYNEIWYMKNGKIIKKHILKLTENK
ncbi:ATP-binding cassette domain-containing protein [Enterobacteriaceae endosymbiont of Donacia bicoloricornis]|uniref:ATP-binding cassette domain-containing protein n=1 Tax=Enterobacteriaceae endosymbiont of Donacia bicoloricornis TaxID=2675772 RepID=UPI001448BC11|nr:ATP-binding cassette domain-containing protein [Enterobacteriaceae endosymbiont of Donacia bicoloricornis]QJC37929.1 ATP-binding cassette domain-containing protein [Enterobacteriaceae endosymbiont of Donacia bicoloricornis]